MQTIRDIMEKLFLAFVRVGGLLTMGYLACNYWDMISNMIRGGVHYESSALEWIILIWWTTMAVSVSIICLREIFEKIKEWIRSKKGEDVA